jgi:NAD-reducing hydrogenase large subunit
MSILKAAKDLIKSGEYDQGILNRIEMAIRPYDPCLSCATHAFGKMAIRLEILDSDGQLVDTLANY